MDFAHAWQPAKAAKSSMHAALLVAKNWAYHPNAKILKPKFRALFSFAKKEIALFFTQASYLAQIHGIKLLIERNPAGEQAPIDHGKILIIVSRKVGKACIRNRLRRQIQAVYYEHDLGTVPLRLALITYPQVKDLSFDELSNFLTSTLKRVVPSKTLAQWNFL